MYVITHKAFDYPLPTGYTPILVGADKNDNPNHYQPDNEGENISDKNPSYCELTGLYWLWKMPMTNILGFPTIVGIFRNIRQEVVCILLQLSKEKLHRSA